MHSLTLLLIPILFLSSCSIDWNDEKDKKIAELNQKIEEQKEEIKKVRDDEIFKKNKECAKYLDTWNENIGSTLDDIKENSDNTTEGQMLTNPIAFYSQKLSSCVYAYGIHNFSDGTTYFNIKNILTNEDIYASSSSGEGNDKDEWNAFNEKISSLK